MEMNTRKLGTLIGVAALALACGRADETAGAAAGNAQTFSEAAGELANDVAADVSAGTGAAVEADRDATDASKKDAAPAIGEGIRAE